ncbi:hypothetical protein RJT34_06116 [Clitoria ternatea]|uniref:Uncharacterized protein n=1 Tax=Clitoria ternatea TaxID=43366 RepID=A0AAN9PSY5_CLITE
MQITLEKNGKNFSYLVVLNVQSDDEWFLFVTPLLGIFVSSLDKHARGLRGLDVHFFAAFQPHPSSPFSYCVIDSDLGRSVHLLTPHWGTNYKQRDIIIQKERQDQGNFNAVRHGS